MNQFLTKKQDAEQNKGFNLTFPCFKPLIQKHAHKQKTPNSKAISGLFDSGQHTFYEQLF